MIRRWHDRERQRLRQALNHPAASAWENLGLWSRVDQPYSDAARALALRVGEAAGLQPGDRVLDIGPGAGEDQQRLWRAEYSISDHVGWERTTPPPENRQWQHVLAVDSAYFVPDLWPRWRHLWPQVAAGGTITWTDLYLAQPLTSMRMKARLRITSALANIPWTHWHTHAQWLNRLQQLPLCDVYFEDLTAPVLDGFIRHMAWRKKTAPPTQALRLAHGTAALIEPLLSAQAIGYGLFQARRR